MVCRMGPGYAAYVVVSFHLPPLFLVPLFFTTSHSISRLVSAVYLLGPLGSPHHVDDDHVSSERVWSRSTQIDEPRQATSISGHMTTPSTCILLGQHSVSPTQGEEPLSYGVTRRLRARDRSGLRTMLATPTHYGCEFEAVHTSNRGIRVHGIAPTFSSWLESCCSPACMARSGTFLTF